MVDRFVIEVIPEHDLRDFRQLEFGLHEIELFLEIPVGKRRIFRMRFELFQRHAGIDVSSGNFSSFEADGAFASDDLWMTSSRRLKRSFITSSGT